MSDGGTVERFGRGLTQRPTTQLVVYGFVGKGTQNNWVIGPANVFRPTYLFVWGRGALLSSFEVAGVEQLVYDPERLVPVDLLEPNLSPLDVLELTVASLGTREELALRLASERIVLIGEPLRMAPPSVMNGPFSTCAVGDQVRLEWQGELQALLVVGPQLV